MLYGLSGTLTKNFTEALSKQPVASGFYVFKYDQDGKKSWEYEGKLNGADDHYVKNAFFRDRMVKLSYGSGGYLVFQAFNKRKVFSNQLNPVNGSFSSDYVNIFKREATSLDLGTCHNTEAADSVSSYLTHRPGGYYSTLNFRLDGANVLIRNYYEDGKLEMHRFVDGR